MMWCYTCRLATRLPCGFCSPRTDELWSVFCGCSCLTVYVWVYVWGYFHKATNAINTPSPIKNKPCWLHCMTHFWEWKTLPQGLRMQQSKASDFWSLPPQKPKYSLIIYKVSQLYLTAGRKGFTEKASGWQRNLCYTESHESRAEITLNLTECSRRPKVNKDRGRWVQRNPLCLPGHTGDPECLKLLSCTPFCSQIK